MTPHPSRKKVVHRHWAAFQRLEKGGDAKRVSKQKSSPTINKAAKGFLKPVRQSMKRWVCHLNR